MNFKSFFETPKKVNSFGYLIVKIIPLRDKWWASSLARIQAFCEWSAEHLFDCTIPTGQAQNYTCLLLWVLLNLDHWLLLRELREPCSEWFQLLYCDAPCQAFVRNYRRRNNAYGIVFQELNTVNYKIILM